MLNIVIVWVLLLFVSLETPKGFIIGPLLFLFFINDAKTCVSKGNLSFFADDTSVSFCEASKPLLEQTIFQAENIFRNSLLPTH